MPLPATRPPAFQVPSVLFRVPVVLPLELQHREDEQHDEKRILKIYALFHGTEGCCPERSEKSHDSFAACQEGIPGIGFKYFFTSMKGILCAIRTMQIAVQAPGLRLKTTDRLIEERPRAPLAGKDFRLKA
ncbi:hypothetical protein GX408_02475 [bacterium]|nr:hypothetical protein [bacterium]